MPRRASRRFTERERREINEAVAMAEGKTSAEIVPVVATASGRYDRAEDIAGLWVGLAALAAAWFLLPEPQHESGTWNDWTVWLKPLWMALSAVGGFLVGTLLAGEVWFLRRLFTPRRQMTEEVERAARQVFFDRRVHRTAGASGLLIYLSLYERRCTLLGDQAATEALTPAGLEDLRDRLTRQIRAGDLSGGIGSTILEAGTRLGAAMPRAAADANELPDALVLID